MRVLLLLGILAAAPASAQETTQIPLFYEGLERIYWLHVPKNINPEAPAPLVIMLHGGGGDAGAFMEQTGMNSLADREGFIVAYPRGHGRTVLGKHFGVWNAVHCCGAAVEKNINDVGFIERVIDDISRRHAVDPRRIYASGHFNGAMMSYRLACELSGRIAAIAPYGAVGPAKDCAPAHPVSLFHLHGRQDKCALYNGGKRCGGCFAKAFGLRGKAKDKNYFPCESVPEHVSRWRRIQQCSKKPAVASQGAIHCERYSGCEGGAEVELCAVADLGHAWPSTATDFKACRRRPDSRICKRFKDILGPMNSDVDATGLIWEFFKSHPKPRRKK